MDTRSRLSEPLARLSARRDLFPIYENAGVLLVCAVIALTITGPLGAFANFIAHQGGDIFHNTWIFGRNIANVLDLRSPLSPNIMFPDVYAALYSEVQAGATLIYALPWALTGDDAFSYGVLYFLSYVLTGFFAYKLARHFGVHPVAALVAALLAGFAPYRTGQIEHVQLALFWALAPLYFAIKYLDGARRRDLIWFGLWALPLWCGPSYNLTAFVIVSAVLAAFSWRDLWADRAYRARFFRVGGCCLLAIVLSAWVWRHYFGLDAATVRSAAHNDVFKMDLAFLFIPSPGSWFYPGQFHKYAGEHVDLLRRSVAALLSSPGWAAIILFGLSIVWFRRGPRLIRAMTVAAVLLLVLSLGSTITWSGAYVAPNPVFIALTMVPVLGATRLIGHLFYVAFAFMGIAIAYHLSRRLHPAWAAAAVAAILIESYAPLPSAWLTFPPPRKEPAVYSFLATLPRGPAVFLPLPPDIGQGAAWHKQFEYMRYAHRHKLWMANGINGWFPKSYHEVMKSFKAFPSDLADDWLKDHADVRTIVIDKKSTDMARIKQDDLIAGRYLGFTRVYDDDDYAVYRRP